MKTYRNLILILLILFIGCDSSRQPDTAGSNPPAPGFNEAGSDDQAIEIADQVMAAMGGKKAWENTRCIEWNYFGNREHIWDKRSGMVRINYLNEDQQAVINTRNMEGEVRINGEMITQPDSLSKYLDRAYKTWINDSYWLVMPYKLKDSGVTLKYMGEDTTQNGAPSHILQLTFEEVGVTPENKYHVWVDRDSHLVTQWAFFRENSMEEPNFITPWSAYNKYGDILLSAGRGDRQLSDIAVHDKVPEGVFSLN
ncbi:MAG: hypothetical protein KFF73_16075 [Cyclobacteriaceae bacterium]|nr:hypothetical protein [Cyclobacteriaceae bacterium]